MLFPVLCLGIEKLHAIIVTLHDSYNQLLILVLGMVLGYKSRLEI